MSTASFTNRPSSARLAPKGQAPLPLEIKDWPSYFGRMGAEYDSYAFKGAALRAYADHELQLVLAALRSPVEPGRLLDIGVGTARFSFPLSELGWNISALDGSQEMLDVVGSRIPNASRTLGRLGEPLPFDDQSFDAVIAMRVVKYVADTASAIREMTRVARIGANLVFDVPNGQSLARLGYHQDTIGFVTPKSLRVACADAGLRVVAIHGAPRLPHPLLVRATSKPAGRAVAMVERTLTALLGQEIGSRALIVEAVRER
jgi:SAM-dependent methyltransferase